MSMMEPYNDPSFSQMDGDEQFEPMQMQGGPNWQGGWQGGWSPGWHGGGHPGWCYPGCGCRPPPRPGWGFWGKNAFLTKSIIDSMISKGMIAPGPNWTSSSGPTTGPITGVTDGSDAAAGQVGEFLHSQTDLSWSISAAANQIQTIPTLTVTAGDWDLGASHTLNLECNGGDFALIPIPGLTPQHFGAALGVAVAADMDISAGRARLSVSVPTVLMFKVALANNSAATVTGGSTLYVTARRMR